MAKKKKKVEEEIVMIDEDVEATSEMKRLFKLYCVLTDALDKYPMTGKPDKKASYKNGWYDCAYHIYTEMRNYKDEPITY